MSRLYLATFMVVTASLLVAAQLLYMVIDPGWAYRLIEIEGINVRKDAEFGTPWSRQQQVLQLRPEIAIFGSSRVGAGVSTEHTFFSRYLKPHGSFKFHFSSPNIRQVREALDFTHSAGRLRTAVIGLDFFMFNVYHDNGVFRVQAPPPAFSIDALRDVAHTISFQSAKSLRESEPSSQLRMHFRIIEKYYMSPGSEWFPLPRKKFSFQNDDTGYSSWDDFRQIVKLARRDGISLTLYISPMHARLIEALDAVGLYAHWEEWKRGLVSILDEEQRGLPDAGRIRMWDFSGYNSVTTESLPAEDRPSNMRWYRESSHFKIAVGDMVLDRTLDRPSPTRPIPSDFGVAISGRNIEQHLSMVKEQRQRYRELEPTTISEIQKMAAAINLYGRTWQAPREREK